ncbi:response regulator transcription factor [Romeria aff. gracilis LEGE 07310]|uniref:Response regulator transcription factor n=1 Tax=Vasconcelosia minhoensis LEGE 07310 TaxID=915328 RepID=A0A8J7AWL8_9CYAN|nr:response regulator transcription factor [Romeria gracilis]MBE9078588.1 response regulator transcription factor [Romeria aff. gracilis LEGE 07310]
MRLLIVEDDERIADALLEDLTDQHHTVDVVYDGRDGWDYAATGCYDLILLDLMLPQMDGIELCQRLRRAGDQTPILMLTARDTISDRVLGLDAGADDYLVKPFHLQELAARVRALLRRGDLSTPPILCWAELRLDPSCCEVTYRQQPIELSPKEYSLLEFFLRHSRQVFSRGQLLERLWAFDNMPDESTVKVHVQSLRQKLSAAGAPKDLIETVYGLGYRLKQLENA